MFNTSHSSFHIESRPMAELPEHPGTRLAKISLWIAVTVLLSASGSAAAQGGAQQPAGPPDREQSEREQGDRGQDQARDDDRDESDPAGEQKSDATTDDADGTSTPDGTSRHGVPTFDEVDVDRVRPDDLPPRDDTSLPDVLRPVQRDDDGASASPGGGYDTDALPSPPDAAQLNRTAHTVSRRVWPLVAVVHPAGSLQESPSLYRGHAVAISSDPPILVSSYAWLKNVDKVYLVLPADRTQESEQTDRDSRKGSSTSEDRDPTDTRLPQAPHRDMADVSIGTGSNEWLDSNRDRLVQIDLFNPDRHRNLTTLVPRDLSAIDLPSSGLELLDIDSDSPTRMYGHSPYAADASLQMATLAAERPAAEALSFYHQTTWRPAHGAPLVTTDGKLVTVTAMRHPGDPTDQMTLVIPPAPLRSYLEEVRQAGDNP